jgi:O-antigen ligase
VYGVLKQKKYLIACVAMLALALALPPVAERFGDLFAYSPRQLNSFAWRVQVWKYSWGPILESWALGHGLASFRDLSGAFLSYDQQITAREGVDPHNVYLQLWFETGLAGLAAYLGVYWQLVRAFYNRIRWSVAGLSEEYAVTLAFLVVYLVNGIADNMLSYLAVNWYCWFFWGVLSKSMRFQRLAWVGPRAAGRPRAREAVPA